MLIRIGVFLLHTDIKDYKDVSFADYAQPFYRITFR